MVACQIALELGEDLRHLVEFPDQAISLLRTQVVAWGGTSASPSTDRYCGPGDNNDPGTRCTQADLPGAAFMVPAPAVLTAIAVTLNTAPTAGNWEAYEVVRYRAGVATVLTSVQLDQLVRAEAGVCGGPVCQLQTGDLLAVRFTRNGSATRYRHIALEISGIGQIVASRDVRTSSVRYGHAQYGLTNGNAYRLERAARLRNLTVHTTVVSSTVDSVFTVCTGSSNPPPCTGTLTCMLLRGTDTCINDVDGLDLPAGTYYIVKATGQGGSSGRIGFSLEMMDQPVP